MQDDVEIDGVTRIERPPPAGSGSVRPGARSLVAHLPNPLGERALSP